MRRLLLCLCLLLRVAADAQIVHVWDLADTDQPGQVTLYNPDVNDAQYGTPVRAGDLDGDGLDDIVISAMAADGPPGQARERAGEVAVYFSPGRFEGKVDLATNPENVVTVYGEAVRDIFGIKSEVADVDGDGTNDLLVGAFYADGPAGEDAGKLYAISGHLLADLRAAGDDLDLAARPWPAGVTVVHGPSAWARLGVWMAAGDVNGDGVTDVIAGADQGIGATAAALEAGQVWVLPGPLDWTRPLELATPPAGATVIHGADRYDHLGSTVACGDVDGDGFADVIAGAGAYGTLRNAFDRDGGAGDGPDNGRPQAGELYVLFGQAAWPPVIDLAQRPDDAMVMYGADGGSPSPDRLGEEIVTADANGDGRMDLLVGAYRADGPGNGRADAGETYLVYGAPSLRGRVIDMATPPDDVVVIFGRTSQAIIGDALAAGDIHGDGYDELFIGVPGDAGPLDRRYSGGIVVIAGGPDLPREIDLARPSVPLVWIQAPDPSDFSAYWAAAGDLDGDGRVDVMPNGMAGDGPFNVRDNAGEVHAVSGALLAEHLAGVVTAVAGGESVTPAVAGLQAAYPNPFNGAVVLPFDLSRPGRVRLEVHDLAGQRIAVLDAGVRPAGAHAVRWRGIDAGGRAVASGAYLVRLRVDGDAVGSARRVLLIR